jgi:hypothetical protein
MNDLLASSDFLTYLRLIDAACSVAGVLFGRDQINEAEGQLQVTTLAAGTEAAPGENEALQP